jgi:hypothetical protein
MASSARSLPLRVYPALRPPAALLYGTLVVALLDLLDAVVFFGLRGSSPVEILHNIAAGLLGTPAATSGGFHTALIGWCLHFFIAFVIVLVYFAASRLVPLLTRHPYVFGPLYGLAVYGVMNFVVLPLSALPPTPLPTGAVLLNGLLIHAFGVGLPSALFARATAPRYGPY